MQLDRYAKAVVAALVGGYALFQVATGSGSPGGEGITLGEWAGVIVTTVIAGVSVWAVPNSKALPAPVQTPDAVMVNVQQQPGATERRPNPGEVFP